jgi:hypothetical protein
LLVDSLKELQAQTSQTLKKFMQLIGQSTSPVSQELSLEDTLEAFRQIASQCIQDLKQSRQVLKDANTQATIRLEEWIGQSENEHPSEHQLDPIRQYWDNESIEDNNEEEELQS